MRDPIGWSVPCARWQGLTVRVHVFFLLFAAATGYLCWPSASTYSPAEAFWAQATGGLLGVVLIGLVILMASVLVHELSHWLVLKSLGGGCSEIVLGPLGGLTAWPTLAPRRGDWICQLAGPLANLAVSLLAWGLFAWLHGEVATRGWLDPLGLTWFRPERLTWSLVLELTFWVNWCLFLFNLLPAFPFDGGRLVRVGLAAVWPKMTPRRRMEISFWIAVGHSVAILVAGLVMWKHHVDTLFPVWLALLLLAVVLLVGARRDLEADMVAMSVALPGSAADGFRSSVTTTVMAPPIPPEQPVKEPARDAGTGDRGGLPAAADAVAADELDAVEDQQLDSVLSRLHASGMQSLNAQERALLLRASERYRNRMGKRT